MLKIEKKNVPDGTKTCNEWIENRYFYQNESEIKLKYFILTQLEKKKYALDHLKL